MVDLIRRRIAPVLLAGAFLLGVRAVAHAHAMLVSAEPAAGSHLPSSPARVRLVFSEQLEVALAKISLTGGDGRAVKLTVSGDPHDVHALIAPVSGLAAGSYRLEWHIVSADGHPVDGSYLFSIGSGDAAPPPPAVDSARPAATMNFALGGAPVVPSVLQGLAIGALMALAGLLLFTSMNADAGGSSAFARRLSVAAVGLLAANLVAWAANAVPDHSLTRDAFGSALSTHAGRVLLLQGACAVLSAWALWLVRRGKVALIFAVAAVTVSGAIGHPAAIEPIWSIPAKSIHLLALSAWIGGLLRLATMERGNPVAFAHNAARVSAAALAAMLLVAVTGTLQTLLFLPHLRDLIASTYGLVVVAKVAGLFVLIAFGAYHRYRVMPRLTIDSTAPAQLASSVRRELAVMAIVVLLGGLLAYISPPAAPHAIMSSTSANETGT